MRAGNYNTYADYVRINKDLYFRDLYDDYEPEEEEETEEEEEETSSEFMQRVYKEDLRGKEENE